MAFDQSTRNLLQRTVAACRNILAGRWDQPSEGEFTQQLQQIYGINPDGSVSPLTAIAHLSDEELETARILRQTLDHYAAGLIAQGKAEPAARAESVRRIVREQAFTVLNRLAALRLAEERGIVLECVRRGMQSEGFQLFQQSAGNALGTTFETYQAYIGLLFDELATDLGTLFDRWDPYGLLFPRQPALEAVLAELNGTGKANKGNEQFTPERFAALWREDETIGWIYQYYNDPAERKRMRDESAAPRNSRELAVRNQFFTPRYVVEFLTDNTLGRLWYEMTKGRTQLARRCRYLIRRPSEVFLGNPAVISCLNAAMPWVREVILTANFSYLPEDPTVGELSDLGLAIDGYGEMERRGRSWDDFIETFYNPQASAAEKSGEPWKGDTFELWCALFAYQRGVLRHGDFTDDDRASGNTTLRDLWPALRLALQHPPTDLSQEELLRQPVFIPHRPIKDPREIRILDPACGSMHFGLYAFDLLEIIYAEAFAAHTDCGTSALRDGSGRVALADVASDATAFGREVPRLIIEHNLHGIDIDPRAVQIAGLSLWLRAQRAWELQGLAVNERPQVRRSHIVCAEPMPGEKDLLRSFVEQQFPNGEGAILLPLLQVIWEKMQLAGEIGSLLQIEEEIRSATDQAQAVWHRVEARPRELFFTEELNTASRQPELAGLERVMESAIRDPQSAITGEFWQTAGDRIYDALRAFAESAGGSYQRRLFVDDAARGFAFIDLCRQRYDVALMNPPFGDASLPSRAYIEDTYGDTKGDVYKAFVECFHARLVPAGYLGIISSRTGFFLGQSEDWRTRVVLRLFRPIALADLGSGVLDAMVEVTAYVLRSLSASEARDLIHSIVPVLGKVVRDSQDRFSLPKWQAARGGLKRHQAVAELEHLEAHGFVQRSSGDTVRYTPLWHLVKKVTAPSEPVFPPLVCVRAINEDAKGEVLIRAADGRNSRNLFISSVDEFRRFPGATFSYWATSGLRRVFREFAQFEGNGRTARRGPSSGDDFRRVRLWVEIPPQCVGRTEGWVPFAKGGQHNPFYSDVHLLVAWEERRMTFHGFFGRPGRMIAKVESVDRFFQFGLTWPIKNRFSFKPWPLPAGCVFAHVGPSAFFPDRTATAVAWGLMSSAPFTALARITAGWNFEAGVIQQTPVPDMGSHQAQPLAALSQRAWAAQRTLDDVNSVSHAFVLPAFLGSTGTTLAERAAAWAARVRTSEETVAAIQAEIDDLAFRLYGLDAADRASLTSTLATEATGDADADADAEAGEDEEEEEEAATADAPALAADLLAYALGCAFGRWDIRYATGERPAPPAPDPFAPLPVCPPGMLQNSACLPAASGDVPASYPVRITWPGLLVDDPAHPEDIERRVREVLAVLFPGRADAIADEACALLGVKSLREWFRKPAGFFADHLKRYSKSRRQAPIYWPLSTASGSYTLWLHYHRLTPDTLFRCLQDFVEPKLRDAENAIARLRAMEAAEESGAKDRKQLEEAETLRTELHDLRDELAHWAPRWKPNLNDGVQITASPLWKLFRLPKWQKLLETTWKDLAGEEYEWAHLALTLWPDRVRKACESDRSLAIAHGLEELCKIEAPKPKGKGKKKPKTQENTP